MATPEVELPEGFTLDSGGETPPAAGLPEGFALDNAEAGQPMFRRANKAVSDALPDSVNEAMSYLNQPVSGITEGILKLAYLPGDVWNAMADKVNNKTSKEVSAADLKKELVSNPASVVQSLIFPKMVEAAAELRKHLPALEVKVPKVWGSEDAINAARESELVAPPSDNAAGRVARRAGQEIGAAAVTAVPILKAAQMGVKGNALVRPAIEAAEAAPGKFVAADLTAAGSAGTGAGVAKEIAPDVPGAELVGTIIGAVAPTATVGTLRSIVRGGNGTRQTMEQSLKEFADAGVTPTVGMATRRRFNEAVESGLAILPGSSSRMAVYAEKTARELYDRVDDVTAGITLRPRSPDAAGKVIQEGIAGYVSRFKDTWRKLDSVVAKNVAPDTMLATPKSRAVMVELSDPVNAAAYPQLTKIAQQLDSISQGGQMSYKALRTFRSSVGGLIPESYAANLPQGQLKKLYGALTDDLRAHLQATNPKALAAFERSNTYYAAAMERLDQRLAPLMSSDIPERVFLALERSGHAGRTVINAAKRSVGQDNWDAVAGTIFQRMGMASPGAQDAASQAFSVNTFLTNWSKYGKNKGTLDALLEGTSGGAQFTRDMNAVAKVAERFREAGRVFANPSGTARAIANIGLGTSVASTILSGQPAVTAKILTIAAAANMSARAFTSPKFVRFLAQSTEVPAARLPSLVTRLGSQLASEPEHVQVEIATVLDRLSDEFSIDDRAENMRQ